MQRLYIVFLSFIYTIFGQPFLFSWLHLGGKQYSLKLIVLLLIILYTHKHNYKCSNNIKRLFISFTILSITSALYNYDLFDQTILLYFDVVYFFNLFLIYLNDTKFKELIYKADFYLVHIVAASTVLSVIAYLYNPGFFLALEVADYPVFYNRFVGMISSYNFRTCWYFAEPSYCGFYLGVHLILYIGRVYDSYLSKSLSLLLITCGLFVTASMGSAIYVTLSLLVLIALKLRINKTIITSCLYISIIAAVVILPSFDVYSLEQDKVDMEQSSYDDRQDRMNLAIKMRQDMSIIDYAIGCGSGSTAVKFHKGLSDVYNKLLCEHGLIYLILFLFVVRKLIKDNLPAYAYVLLSYLSVIIHATPIVLIIYLNILYQTNINRSDR